MKRLHKTWMVAIFAGVCAGTLPALAVTDFERGNDLYAKGQYRAAVDAYVDAICATPKSYIPHYQLGNTYMKLGRLQEAQTEYEMCLEMYPDAKTKANTRKALAYITGSPRGNAAVAPSTEDNVVRLDQDLASAAEKMLQADNKRIEQKRQAIEKAGEKQSEQIKASVKTQIEQLRAVAPAYRIDYEKNDRVGYVPVEVERALHERAEADAKKAIEMANEKAKSLPESNAADTADGLRSQIYNRGNSNVRLSPVGTNVYVRNYQTGGGKVADTGNNTK